MRDSRRSGSALLIVLGMFAFMLVSAVAFSMYMRSSRAPSSYVRRNAAARQLVKAALARAIDEIDTAIGNDPFPGVGNNHYYGRETNPDKPYYNRVSTHDGRNDDWHGRVFTPLDEVAAKDTVSTLTLEALGYLPPSLINEVRYWSRHTRTAKWHSFNYGLGRYAFTAVNVSDFFDLGALAGKDDNGDSRQYLNRSSAPHGRVSPTYLFRTSEKGAMNTGHSKASGFLSMLANGRPAPAEVPLVSLMDYNLSYFRTSPDTAVEPPFLSNGGSFLNGSKFTEENARHMVFMAGGWNGCSNITYEAYKEAGIINLQLPEFQPFYNCGWNPDGITLSGIVKGLNDNPFRSAFENPMYEMPAVSMAMLSDYLDYDGVPLSLCIPCVEAVPMLCGVMLNDPPKIKTTVRLDENTQPADPTDPNSKAKITRKYCIDVEIPPFSVTLTSVFPFKKPVLSDGGDFSADVIARVFFTANKGKAWLDEPLRSDSDLTLGTDLVWPEDGVSSGDNFSFRQVCVSGKTVKANGGSGSASEESTVQGNIRFPLSGWQTINFVATFVYEDSVSPGNLKESTVENDFTVYDETWQKMSVFEKLKDALNGNPSALYFQPSVAVWARIKTGEDTVDMVPAVPACDNLNKQPANASLPSFAKAAAGSLGGPLLRFIPKKEDSLAIQISESFFPAPNSAPVAKETEWEKQTPAYVASDPRINWAPEQWWFTDGDPQDKWLPEVKDFQGRNKWCDLDIFMSVSDQGYLQSMYELMMIPQVQRFNATANSLFGVFEGRGVDEYNGVIRTRIDDVAFSDVMWRTYRTDSFYREPSHRNDSNATGSTGLTNWGSLDDLAFVDPENGLRVNPYTDITNIMLGAFANMPRNWSTAGTNWNNSTWQSEKGHMKPESKDFKDNDEYLFKWSKEWDSVYDTAAFWMEAFRGPEDSANDLHDADGWKSVFDDVDHTLFDWSGEHPENGVNQMTSQFKAEISSSVDRKFLYGYLKGCFANAAQMFLVFVRAESVAGSGGAGSGARAVALVWRDPRAPRGHEGKGQDNAQHYLKVSDNDDLEESWRMNPRKPEHPPHRTRILFYHQLD